MRSLIHCCLVLLLFSSAIRAAEADLIFHNGKIVSVDKKFSVHQAMAVQGERILAVGSDADILKMRGDKTQVLDLKGKTVLPGLIDSHVHPTGAAMTEFDHPLPEMETIQDVLDYVKARAEGGAGG